MTAPDDYDMDDWVDDSDCDYYCRECGGDDHYCYECGGTGWIVTCFDDICRGGDHCIHGDGEEPCPECNPYGDP